TGRPGRLPRFAPGRLHHRNQYPGGRRHHERHLVSAQKAPALRGEKQHMADEEPHLWSHQDGARRLNLSLVDRKSFHIQEMDDYTFLHPKHTKWDWPEQELLLRSTAV